MADGGPHWHPDDIGRLTYAQVVLFCQDRSQLVQRLKNKRKHEGARVRTVTSDTTGAAPPGVKLRTAPGGKSLAQHAAEQQAKEGRHAKRRRRKRRKDRHR